MNIVRLSRVQRRAMINLIPGRRVVATFHGQTSKSLVRRGIVAQEGDYLGLTDGGRTAALTAKQHR